MIEKNILIESFKTMRKSQKKEFTDLILKEITDNYKLTASGAVFESFSMGIPVIALHNDYFDYLSSKIGDFGLFFDNFEQMKSFFAAPYEFDTERMFLSIKKARKLFTSENVSKKLKIIIK